MSELTCSRLSNVTRDWFADSTFRVCADKYARYLFDRGYASGTINGYLRCIAHFAHWSVRCRAELWDVNEAVIARFLNEHLPTCHCAPRCRRARTEVRAALTRLLELLRADGLIAKPASTLPAAIAAELFDFDSYLTEVRGLVAVTRHVHLRSVRAFLLSCFGNHRVEVCTLKPADIVRFMMMYTAQWQPSSVKVVSTSLRSYLRFKAVFGAQTTTLIAALPGVAQWRLARLPRALSAAEIQQLLDTFDRRTPTGRRDYAIARCYVDLGLRTSEIVRLQLDDVDWRQGVLQIRGKGRRTDTLPLPVTTGRAMVAYLRQGRRVTASRALFLRHRPPHDTPATPDTIRAAIRNAAQRCGLAKRLTGAHILRHTLAHRLVQSGTSLKEIADLLRHRSLDTTTIYAKVDLKALATVASPWPGRRV